MKKKKKSRNKLYYEHKFIKLGYDVIIGVDEAGRGPLAGPVVAAAALLKTTRFKNRIDDSKKLSPALRELAFTELLDKSVFGVGIISEKLIDQVNILEATRLAMQQAVVKLSKKLRLPDNKRVRILVDGDIRLDVGWPMTGIISGDAKSKSIASASILAKVIRDRIMASYDRIYPQYGFIKHKGYPTRAHRLALKKFGPSLIHRKSFYCV